MLRCISQNLFLIFIFNISPRNWRQLVNPIRTITNPAPILIYRTIRKNSLIVQSQLLSLEHHSWKEVYNGLLLINFTCSWLLNHNILKGLLSSLVAIKTRMESLDPFLIACPILLPHLLDEVRHGSKNLHLVIKGLQLYSNLSQPQLFSHLDSIHYFWSSVKFFIELLNNFVFNYSVGSSKTSFFPLSWPKGKHVVVLIRIGFPK